MNEFSLYIILLYILKMISAQYMAKDSVTTPVYCQSGAYPSKLESCTTMPNSGA